MNFPSGIIFKTDDKEFFEVLRDSKIFSRYIDLLIFVISIGILYDIRSEPEGEDQIEINKSTVMDPDISESLDFLFATAILTSKKINNGIDINTKIKLAFHDDFELEKFNKQKFLLEFAPYGVKVLKEKLDKTLKSGQNHTSTLHELKDYTEELVRGIDIVDVIEENFTQ